MDLRAIGADHHKDEDDGVNEHAVIGELAQRLGKNRQHRSGDNGTAHVAQTAQDHEDQNENRGIEVEFSGGKLREITAKERSGSTGKGSGDNKGDHAVLGDRDTYALGSDTIVTHRLDCTTGAAAYQVEHDDECNHDEHKTGHERGIGRNARGALGAFDDGNAVVHKVQVVDRGIAPKVEHDMQAMSVDTHDQAGHNLLDDLAKSKGDDSQVVAAQAKHGNADDKSGLVMLQNTKAKKLTYSLRTLADFKGKILESHFEGTDLIINGREVMVHFVGRFNAYNLLAVYGAAVSLGKDPEEVLIVLSTLRSVSGRFETIQSPLGYTAIVDYAHTPDALTNVLNGIHEVLDGKGRIITVVGAGGNRDKGKRPLMAKEAVKLSDQVILTSDNPRFEEPDDIINDMVAGLTKMDMERTLCITDRTQAIKTATMLAKKGDVILVAGKGHEDYQEIKGVKQHFDDREKLREIFSTQQS